MGFPGTFARLKSRLRQMAGNQVRYGPNGPGNQAPGRSATMVTRTASRGRYRVDSFQTRADLEQIVEKYRRLLRPLKRLGLPPWLRQESQKRLFQRPRRAAAAMHSKPTGARTGRRWSLLTATGSTAQRRERPRASHSSTRLRRKPRLLLKRDAQTTEHW